MIFLHLIFNYYYIKHYKITTVFKFKLFINNLSLKSIIIFIIINRIALIKILCNIFFEFILISFKNIITKKKKYNDSI